MPTYLKVTALWGGQAGSLLFWNLMLAARLRLPLCSATGDKQKELMPYALMVASLTQVFFLFITVCNVENPFARIAVAPPDGNGLNPLLRHPGMIIHPPMLYLGFVGFTIPYTFAMAALMSNHLDDTWITSTRRWTLVAWLFLKPGADLGRPLGLRRSGMGRLLGLGSGRKCVLDSVARRHGLPSFGYDSGKARTCLKIWNMILIIMTYQSWSSYGTFVSTQWRHIVCAFLRPISQLVPLLLCLSWVSWPFYRFTGSPGDTAFLFKI